ncbi:uncharacterized protein BDV14DRAFT_184062 [Aspergillus stella-maris]|uniref:uncharacterized protein n=1 Tax=Aspergillus stella-maris TaxID=1810926 RepID=UPI003CCDEC75
MISLKIFVFLFLAACLSAQELYTKPTTTITTTTWSTLPTPTPSTLTPLTTPTPYHAYSTLYASQSSRKKKPNLTPLIVLIPLLTGIGLMAGIFACVTRCGRVVRDPESQTQSQSQQQQQRWGDSSRAANAGVHLERVQAHQERGTAGAAPRYVLRDENGVTVVEEAPPVYSVDPPR